MIVTTAYEHPDPEAQPAPLGADYQTAHPGGTEGLPEGGARPRHGRWRTTWPLLTGIVLTLGGVRHATVETEIYLLTTTLFDLPAAAG